MAKKKKKKLDDDEDLTPKKKKKKSKRDFDEDEIEDVEDDVDVTTPRKRNDVFVGLATMSLLIMITAAVFFAVDYDELVVNPLPAVTVSIGALPALGATK